MRDVIKDEVTKISKEANTLKTDLKNTKAKLTAAENDLKKTKTGLKDLGKVVDDHKTIFHRYG